MTASRPLIIYIHGFNSSPASEKAQEFITYCQSSVQQKQGLFELSAPALSHDPEAAIAQLEALIHDADKNLYLLVGSSLGGYYATYLAEKYQCRAALINPAVSPVKHLGEGFLGRQKNLYTGEEYEFTREYGIYLDSLDINPLQHPENYLLLVQTGDEVLNYHLAVERYADSLQVVQKGGGHRFEGFKETIPAILEFAANGSLCAQTKKTISTIKL